MSCERNGLSIVGLIVALPTWAAPGDHLPVGDGALAPRVSLGLEHSTNPYRLAEVDAGSGATNLKLAPGLDLLLERDDLDLRAEGTYELRKYFAADDVALDRYDDFKVEAHLAALKTSVVGLGLQEAVGRLNVPLDSESRYRPYTSQLRNQTVGSIHLRPRTALELSAGGRYVLDDYQTSGSADETDRHYNTRHAYGPRADISWSFFPRTSLVADLSFEHAFYTDPVVSVPDGEDVVLPDHDSLRVIGGLRGQVTERMEVTLTAGYGSAVYDESSVADADPDAAVDLTGLQRLLVDGVVRYAFSEDDELRVGIEKGFRDSYFTNFVSYTRGFATGEARFGGRIGAAGTIHVTRESYRGTETRNDTVLGAEGSLTYHVQEWASVTGGGVWQQRTSTEPTVDFGDLTGRLQCQFTY